MAYYLNNQQLPDGQPFTIGDLTYPWSYLEILSTTQLSSMGITQIAPAAGFDSKYYWDVDLPKNLEDREEVDSETDEPLYVKVWDPEFDNGEDSQPGAMVDTTERLVSLGLKTTCTAEIKSKAGSILAKTDWYLYRLAEREVEVPENIATHRAAIIAESDRLETAIAAVTDVEELIAVMNSQDWDDSLNPTV
jgi:hypothetical protein